ncbi:MAG: hypothetical protein M3O70_22750 [Actinomycetota bacterium]|nr:hypothetical protein [Actinomycetota bacterium]
MLLYAIFLRPWVGGIWRGTLWAHHIAPGILLAYIFGGGALGFFLYGYGSLLWRDFQKWRTD